MPIYEYYCPNCNAEYEVIRPVAKADEPAACGECGKPGQRQLSTFSFKSDTFSAPHLKALPQKPLRPYHQKPRGNNPEDSTPG